MTARGAIAGPAGGSVLLLGFLLAAGACRGAEPVVVVCLGDSITKGVSTDPDSTPYPEQLQALLGDRYVVINSGVPSANTAGLLGGYSSLVSSRKPRVVALLAGVNDIAVWDPSDETRTMYRPEGAIQRLRELGARTTALGARTIYLTIWPDDDFTGEKRDAIVKINRWVLEKSPGETPGSMSIDNAPLTDRAGNLRPNFHDGSNLHLNQAGHRQLAEAVANVIRQIK